MRVMGPESGFCTLSVGFSPHIGDLGPEWGSWALSGAPGPLMGILTPEQGSHAPSVHVFFYKKPDFSASLHVS